MTEGLAYAPHIKTVTSNFGHQGRQKEVLFLMHPRRSQKQQ